MGIMALVWVNIKNKTAANHQGALLNNSPMEHNKAIPAHQRMRGTRSPLRSLSQPHRYGANTRVTACMEVSKPIIHRLKPKCFNHKGK